MKWGDLGGELVRVNFKSWQEEPKRAQGICMVNLRMALESLSWELYRAHGITPVGAYKKYDIYSFSNGMQLAQVQASTVIF